MATSSNRPGANAGRRAPRPPADGTSSTPPAEGAANHADDGAPNGPRAGDDGASHAQASSSAATDSAGAAPASAADSLLDGWFSRLAHEQLAWQVAACRALLQGAKTVREAQIEAAGRAESRHKEAAERLGTQRGNASGLACLQLELAQANAEEAAAHGSRLREISAQGSAQWLEQAAAGWARCSSALWEGWADWSRRQAQWSMHPELVEAEVEQVADTVSALPLVWPAQEAARQAMGLAASTWNDWLSWGQREAASTRRPH